MKPAAKNGRIPYIDNVKGFGMLLVVLGHVMNSYSTDEMYDNNMFMDFVAVFYMKMFFFFSGFVFIFKNEMPLEFIKKSFVSLIWPCLVIWGGNVLTISLIRGMCGYGFLPDIPQKELIDFYWFCKCLFVCRIALFCICKLHNKINKWWTNEVLVSVAFIVLLYALSNYIEWWGARHMMQYYILGYAAKKYNLFTKFKENPMICLSFITIVGLSVLRYSTSMPLLVKLTSVTLPLPIMLFVYYVFKRYLNKEIWRLTEVGRQSLLVYLLHIAFLCIISTSMKIATDTSVFFHLWFWIPMFLILTELSLMAAKYIKANSFLCKIILLKK